MEKRETLSSRIGFIFLAAGCAIGVGNVWRFPWMVGQYGGGAFVVVYLLFLILLGLPVMTMELSIGRAAQKSPALMYQRLEPKGTIWHVHGPFALAGNIVLLMSYTVLGGYLLKYFTMFVRGDMIGLDTAAVQNTFLVDTIANAGGTVIYNVIIIALAVLIVSFKLKGGLERFTKYMMSILFVLMISIALYASQLSGANAGLAFYLKPDFSKINGQVIVAAMNQAFFTLSLGIGSMAIFGSYIGKERSLMGESSLIILLDTFVAIVAGLIIFPVCFTYGIDPNTQGSSLLFVAMTNVFANMNGGSFLGACFFLFMTFAAFSTILAVFEGIQACVSDLTGWSRRKTCLICGVGLMVLSLPACLENNLWSDLLILGRQPSAWEDFYVSNCALPLGSVIYVLFCTWKSGWGWDNFVKEANTGKGLKVKNWIRPYVTYVLPVIVVIVFVIGIVNFF